MNYEQSNRGVIQYRERRCQIVDYSGLKYGNITPTDIDGVIEYRDKAYAFIELKHGKAEMPGGQERAMKNLVDNLASQGKLAAAFLCEHYVHNPQEDVDATKAIVRKVYYNGNWQEDGKRTLKTRLDAFMNFAKSL